MCFEYILKLVMIISMYLLYDSIHVYLLRNDNYLIIAYFITVFPQQYYWWLHFVLERPYSPLLWSKWFYIYFKHIIILSNECSLFFSLSPGHQFPNLISHWKSFKLSDDYQCSQCPRPNCILHLEHEPYAG